jgi:nitrilase
MPTIRLGTCSPSTRPTTAQTLARLSTLAARAASQNVDLVLFPEAFLGGYPRGSAFGTVIGDRSAAGREEYLRYFRSAVDLGDSALGDEDWASRGQREAEKQKGDGTREELEQIARRTGVFLVVGVIERSGGSLYCAMVYVCPNQGMVGKRRKVLPVSVTP